MTKKYKAIIYEVTEHDNGDITLRRVTTVKKLTVPQIAHSEEVSIATIYREIENGNLPARRIGSCVRIDIEDYVAYSNQRKTQEYETGGGSRTLAELARTMKN